MDHLVSVIRDVVLAITGAAVAIATVHKEIRETRQARDRPPADPE